MEALIKPLLPAIILLALVFVPLTVVVGTVLYLKRQEGEMPAARHSPTSCCIRRARKPESAWTTSKTA